MKLNVDKPTLRHSVRSRIARAGSVYLPSDRVIIKRGLQPTSRLLLDCLVHHLAHNLRGDAGLLC